VRDGKEIWLWADALNSGLAPGALGRDRFLNVGLANGLQLLVLRGAQNFLQLRCVFAVDSVELFSSSSFRKAKDRS